MRPDSGVGTITPDAISMPEIEDLWKQLFVENNNHALTQTAKSLRAAVCGQSHAVLCFGPRIECDSLLRVARDIFAAIKPVYAFTHFPQSVHSYLEPGNEAFYVRPVPAALPEWLSQDSTMQPVLFAILGPREAVIEVSTFLNETLEGKRLSRRAKVGAEQLMS